VVNETAALHYDVQVITRVEAASFDANAITSSYLTGQRVIYAFLRIEYMVSTFRINNFMMTSRMTWGGVL
jgi:hypothetical protein